LHVVVVSGFQIPKI